MIEADSQLKLLPASTLDLFKVLEAIHIVHGHMAVASNSYTHTTWLIFWGSASLAESK